MIDHLRRMILLVGLSMLSVIPGFAADSDEPPLSVAVSVPPQAELVAAVGGDLVEVVVAVPPGSSPHVFDPTPQQVAQLAAARLYVATGVEVEIALLPRLRAINPGLRVIGEVAENHDHDHHDARDDHGHHHDGIDPHRWLDPRQAADQVQAIAGALTGLLPDQADTLAARADAEVDALMQLHAELATVLEPVRGRDLVVAHPAFGHLAAAYGLNQVAIEHAGHQPSPRHLAEVLERVRQRGTSTLFVQPQFPIDAARSLARTVQVELVTLDPLAPDLKANLRSMAGAIASALATSGDS
jgi:zinc transport system substrate-binding protein